MKTNVKKKWKRKKAKYNEKCNSNKYGNQYLKWRKYNESQKKSVSVEN